MSEHHHHRPNEGHSSGGSTARQKLRHSWFWYLSGILIFIALLGFIFEQAIWRFQVTPPEPPAASTNR